MLIISIYVCCLLFPLFLCIDFICMIFMCVIIMYVIVYMCTCKISILSLNIMYLMYSLAVGMQFNVSTEGCSQNTMGTGTMGSGVAKTMAVADQVGS